MTSGPGADADWLRLSAGEFGVERDLRIVAHALELADVVAAHDPGLERREPDRLAPPSWIARTRTLSRESRWPLWTAR